MGHWAGLASLTCRHVVEDVLHGSTVWEGALPELGPVHVSLLLLRLLLFSVSPLAFVGVEK